MIFEKPLLSIVNTVNNDIITASAPDSEKQYGEVEMQGDDLDDISI